MARDRFKSGRVRRNSSRMLEAYKTGSLRSCFNNEWLIIFKREGREVRYEKGEVHGKREKKDRPYLFTRVVRRELLDLHDVVRGSARVDDVGHGAERIPGRAETKGAAAVRQDQGLDGGACFFVVWLL